MDGCMFCGRSLFKKYLYDIHKPIKNVYVDEEVRDLLGEKFIDFSDEPKICLPCVCLVHTLCQFKHIMKATLITYPKDGTLLKDFKKLKANLLLIPYSACTDDDIDDYKSKHHSDGTSVAQEKVCQENLEEETAKSIVENVEEVPREEEREDEMLSVMYSERISRASVYSPTSQEVSKSFKKTRARKKVPPKSIVTRSKSAPCEPTAKLPYDIRMRKSHTPYFETNIKEDQIVYRCLLSICYHHYESFDQLLHHVKSVHGLQQNDLNFEEYKQKLEEYLEKKNSKLKFDLHTNVEVSISKDIESKYPCLISDCFRKYTCMTDLNRHKMNGHSIWPRYSCSECYKVKFTSRDDLLIHNYLNHFIINSYCVYCSEPLKNMDELYYHLETHKMYKHPCNYCDKFFFSLDSAQQHSKIHRKDKYKKKIQRPPEDTIILRKDMVDVNVPEPPSQEEVEFSRIRLQPKYQERKDEIANLSTPDDQFIISRRNSFGESTSSEDKFDDFTVPDVPDDEEGSTISDYINKSWLEINSENELNTSFDLDKCEEESCISDLNKKKCGVGNEEGVNRSEVMDRCDDASTISEFIKKRNFMESADEPNLNKKIALISEYVLGGNFNRSHKDLSNIDINFGTSSKGKGDGGTEQQQEFNSLQNTLNEQQQGISGKSNLNQDVYLRLKSVEEKMTGVVQKSEDTVYSGSREEGKVTKNVNTKIYNTTSSADSPVSVIISNDEMDGQSKVVNLNSDFSSDELRKNTSPEIDSFLSSDELDNNPNYAAESDSEDFSKLSELEKKYNLKKLVVILEDCTSLIQTQLNMQMKKLEESEEHLEQARKSRLGKNKKIRKKTVEVLPEPTNIDASSFEQFAAQRLGLEIDNTFAGLEVVLNEHIPYQADLEIPCETVEITAEEVSPIMEDSFNNFAEPYPEEFILPETSGISEDKSASNEGEHVMVLAEEIPVKTVKKRVRKREIQLLQQITPLEMTEVQNTLSDTDSKLSRRGRARKHSKRFEAPTFDNPPLLTASEIFDIIPGTSSSNLQDNESSSSPTKKYKRKGEDPPVLEPEPVKVKRLGMTDLIKRITPNKPKFRNNAL